MAIASTRKLTLAEFWALELAPDSRYELVAGELRAMPPESEQNRRLAMRLLAFLLQQGFEPEQLTLKTELVTLGARATVRLPDLMLLSPELAAELAGATRSTIAVDMPPPLLVVEVVSPGQANADRDYRYKRSEYGARGIGEYWIVDPQRRKVTVLVLVNGFYEESVFEAGEAIRSPLLGTVALALEF